MVVFEKCDKTVRKCKSETEIEQWMQLKFILTLDNTKTFIANEFEDRRIQKQATIHWYPVSHTSRADYVNLVTRANFNLNDYIFNLSNMRIDLQTGFDIEKRNTRNIPYKNLFQNSVTYEISLTRLHYTRIVYSFLDLMKDVGGLFSAIGPLFGLIVSLLQYRGALMQLTTDMMLNNG